MKKVVLSVLVATAFLLYSIHQRNEGSGAVVLPPTAQANGSNSMMQQGTTSGNSGQMQQSTGTGHMSGYRDGTYTGSVEDAFYGNVQVQATIHGGKIVQVAFLDHPQDNPTSRAINGQAMPYLQQEAISTQNAQVNIITGATDTSLAFIQSLTTALSHAN